MGSSSGFWVFLAVALIVLGLSLLYIVQSTALRDLTAQMAQAQDELDREQEINRSLELAIEQAFSASRVSRIARDQLGMIEPTEVTYVSVPAQDD